MRTGPAVALSSSLEAIEYIGWHEATVCTICTDSAASSIEFEFDF